MKRKRNSSSQGINDDLSASMKNVLKRSQLYDIRKGSIAPKIYGANVASSSTETVFDVPIIKETATFIIDSALPTFEQFSPQLNGEWMRRYKKLYDIFMADCGTLIEGNSSPIYAKVIEFAVGFFERVSAFLNLNWCVC